MTTIQHNRSNVSGRVPSTLADGELAINIADGVHFWKDSSGTIRTTPLLNLALLASPVFTGNPQAPTPLAGDNTTSLSTTAFVASAIASRLRFDAAQTLTGTQQTQGIANLGGTTAGQTLFQASSAGVQKTALAIASTDITDGTAPGRTLFTASSVAAQRSALGVNVQTVVVFSSSNASWAVPAGIRYMEIEVFGGGGSGSGGDTAGPNRGSAGGGGGYVYKFYTGTMDSTLAVTIGSGSAGPGSGTGGNNGVTGGTSTVVGSSLGTLSAGGGGGGVKVSGAGGAGGAASGGDLNIAGQGGNASSGGTTAVPAGGNCPRGGNGGNRNVSTNGDAPGGGGSAGNHVASTNGGTGAAGLVIIRYG